VDLGTAKSAILQVDLLVLPVLGLLHVLLSAMVTIMLKNSFQFYKAAKIHRGYDVYRPSSENCIRIMHDQNRPSLMDCIREIICTITENHVVMA